MTTPDELVRHFAAIYVERMQGLPIVNPELSVEAVAFEPFEAHQLGVLISPWFMNLFLLPGDDSMNELAQGDSVKIELPSGAYDFTVSHDDAIGTLLSAILFRTVADFPDQETARAIAEETARLVRSEDELKDQKKQAAKPLSRREFFANLGAG
ncbi:MAG: [NiFe]-hydrogenase assembly chaperone HybE [Woeseiaceae bacterium]|nr:[NiFe]-hydrogenase assembly chaperone HybE [Woeseiaceae bacterium]